MSEKRKKALVVYLAALFGVAFIIVTISLVIQVNQGNSLYASAADKVEALQVQVQQLTADNKNLQQKNGDLEEVISDIQEGQEYLEGVAAEATLRIQELEMQMQVKDYMINLQKAYSDADEEALTQALEYLEPVADLLTEEELEIYQTILASVTPEE